MNQPTEQKIDCVVCVVTPENIEFEYLLAGPFQRLPAFLIDLAVRAGFFVALIIAGLLAGIPLAGRMGFAATLVLGFIGFFVLSWLYGMIMEAQFSGRTVGKILLGLRVISTDGRPINASQAALRNLLRIADLWPPLSLSLFFPDSMPASIIPTFFVGMLSMTLTSRMQRIGDLAAGTMVVWDGRRGVSTNLQPEDARAFALAELVPPTFQISRTLARAVGLYMERRRFLSAQRRQEIAYNLAQPLFAQFDLLPDTSADLLLCALYVRIYHSEQQRTSKLEALKGSHLPRSSPTMPQRAANMPLPINPHPSHPAAHQPSAQWHPSMQSHASVHGSATGHRAPSGHSEPETPGVIDVELVDAGPVEAASPQLVQSTPVASALVPARNVVEDEGEIIQADAVEPDTSRSNGPRDFPRDIQRGIQP